MKAQNNKKVVLKAEKEKQKALLKKREVYHKELEAKQNQNIMNLEPYKGDAFISLQHINKIYPNHVQAVYDFNLDINKREFIVFVGPSGCGKSTTLRMIAGLEDITYGNLFIDKEFANNLLPKSRDCAMVFQSYALYPNMSVYDNMAFSLKVRHQDGKTINDKVLEAAEILELKEYLGRKPSELSGGQRQRVALGRAIVRDARVFLMDEPLSNLDAKLRVQMRSEIVALHKKIGSTTIYVTHDQTEAMTMADRIVVMKDGYIQQIGTPKEIYNNPSNMFVATFIGAPAMNMIDVKLVNDSIELPNGLKIKLTKEQLNKYESNVKLEKENNIKQIEDLKDEIKELNDPQYLKNINEVNELNVQLKSIDKANVEEINKVKARIKELKDANKTPRNKLAASASFKKRIPQIIEINEANIKKLEERNNELDRVIKEKTQDIVLGVRPEDIVSEKASKILEKPSKSFTLELVQVELLGSEYYIHSTLNDKKVIAKISAKENVDGVKEMKFVIEESNIHLFDKDSTKSLL